MQLSTTKKMLMVPYENNENDLLQAALDCSFTAPKEHFSRNRHLILKVIERSCLALQYIDRGTQFQQKTGDCTTSHGCPDLPPSKNQQGKWTFLHLNRSENILPAWLDHHPLCRNDSSIWTALLLLNCKRTLHGCCGKFPLLHIISKSYSHETPWKLNVTGPI